MEFSYNDIVLAFERERKYQLLGSAKLIKTYSETKNEYTLGILVIVDANEKADSFWHE